MTENEQRRPPQWATPTLTRGVTAADAAAKKCAGNRVRYAREPARGSPVDPRPPPQVRRPQGPAAGPPRSFVPRRRIDLANRNFSPHRFPVNGKQSVTGT